MPSIRPKVLPFSYLRRADRGFKDKHSLQATRSSVFPLRHASRLEFKSSNVNALRPQAQRGPDGAD
jgi:hypothetical protein